MFCLLEFFLFCVVQNTLYTYNSSTISTNTLSSSSVINYLPLGDTCGQLMIRNNNLYHFSTANILQTSSLTTLNTYSNIINIAGPSIGRVGFGVNNVENALLVMLKTTINTCQVYTSS